MGLLGDDYPPQLPPHARAEANLIGLVGAVPDSGTLNFVSAIGAPSV
jgi:hypothetical protein